MNLLLCDIDSTLNNHWQRIVRWSEDGRTDPQAFTTEESLRDEPLDYAVDALLAFQKQEWITIILTARDWDLAGEATREWLDLWGFSYHDVITVPTADHKIEVLRMDKVHGPRIGEVDIPKMDRLFIDDFTSGQEKGIPRFCCSTYERARRTGVPVEPFRNNWNEIVERHLNGNRGTDEEQE